jgi:hypothetical protein
MDAPVKYLEELRGELGLYPTWLPGDPITLGSFGRIERGQFVADGHLSNLGIELVPVEQTQDQIIKKQRGMKLNAASQTTAKAGWLDAELGVEFEVAREHAWAFAARGMRKLEIGNIFEVRRAVLEAFKAGDWQRKWLLISELRRVDHLTVLVARSKHARGKIRAKGQIAEPYDILLQEEASFELSTEDVFSVPGIKRSTPLYGCRKLKGLLDPGLETVRGGFDEAPDDDLGLELANNEPLF